MGLVTVDRAQPGMVLAAPVVDKKGRKLIPSDISLTDRHIQALKMWGIAQVEVESDDADEPPPLNVSPEEDERVRASVTERFSGHDLEHPYLKALYEAAVRQELTGSNVVGAAR